MKTITSLVLSLLVFSAAALATAAEQVLPAEAPKAVQQSWARSPELGPVKSVTRRMIDDKVFYDVVFEKSNAVNPRVRYAEDGTVVRIPTAADSLDYTGIPALASGEMLPVMPLIQPLQLGDLPSQVQQTVRREAKGRTVSGIDRESWNRRTVYEVEFAEPGFNPRIHVAEDGNVLRGEKARTQLKSFYLGTQLEDTPPAVQAAIKRMLGDKVITDIDQKGSPDAFTYEVEVSESAGPRRVRFSEKGELLSDSSGPRS